MADPKRQLALIDDFLLDVCLNDEHTFESEVSEYPVEDGADVTDNVRPKPIQVSMECIVSDTPINSEIIDARDGATRPSDEAYVKLLKIRDAREPVDIRTSLATFKNMVLKNLSIPRAQGRAAELHFTAMWQQVQIVSNTRSTRVAIPAAKNGTGKTVTKPMLDRPGQFISINVRRNKWLDTNINEWRFYARPGFTPILGGDTTIAPDMWRLTLGAPDSVSDALWRTMRLDARSAKEQEIAAANKGKPPHHDKQMEPDFKNPSQYFELVPRAKVVFS